MFTIYNVIIKDEEMSGVSRAKDFFMISLKFRMFKIEIEINVSELLMVSVI